MLAAILIALLSIVPAALAVAGPGSAASAPDSGESKTQAAREADYVPGELLVRFDTARMGVQAEVGAAQAVAEAGGRVAQTFDDAARGLRHVVLDEGVDVEDAIDELEGRDDVLFAEPNYRIRATGIPNDSRFGEQYGLHNTGQTVGGQTGTKHADIDAPEAWDVTTGSSAVVVAVLDSGIAHDHPDLTPNMWVNTDEVAGNGIDDDGNGYVDDRRGWDMVDQDNDPVDEQGHGTHVAGTIGARGNNDTAGGGTTDVAGVAWNVRLMPLRVLDETGQGVNVDLVEAIDYARANGARIANLSLSSWNFSHAMGEVIQNATGVTFVVSAGNFSPGQNLDEGWIEYPCSFDLPNIVCVAATDNRDQLASYSNYGPVSVDLAAPGTNVLSTKAYHTVFSDDFETANSQWTFGGTPNTWARSNNAPDGLPGWWLTDSPDGQYPTGTDNWARTTNPLNLSGLRDCTVVFDAWMQIESWFGDFVAVEASNSPNGPWKQAGFHYNGYRVATFDQRIPEEFNGDSQVYVRIHLHEDGERDTGDGIYVDDFSVQCAGRYSSASYEYLSGTSMAAPHVSGVAALVLASNPGFSAEQLKGRLMASVDAKPSLSGTTVTGGRINAYKAVSSTVVNRPPTADAGPDKTVKPGSTVTLPGTGTDPDGGTLRYTWTQVWGTPVTIRNASSPTASFTAPQSTGTLRFRLRVTDPHGVSDVDEVDITVSTTAPK